MQMTTEQTRERQAERIDQFRRLSQSNPDASMCVARESLRRAGPIDELGRPAEWHG